MLFAVRYRPGSDAISAFVPMITERSLYVVATTFDDALATFREYMATHAEPQQVFDQENNTIRMENQIVDSYDIISIAGEQGTPVLISQNVLTSAPAEPTTRLLALVPEGEELADATAQSGADNEV